MIINQIIPFPKDVLELSQIEKIEWQDPYEKYFHAKVPFLYEAAFFHGLEVLKPWEFADYTIPAVIKEWGSIKEELTSKFANRDSGNSVELMKKGIAFFYEILYWCNQQPVVLKENKYLDLVIKPINMGERWNFILSRINKYHSFVQLTELFIEMEKLFYRQQIMKKASKQ